jgi:hypothetical protein
VEVLQAEPDTDTVRALQQLATLEVFAGAPDADRLSAEALNLGEALDVGTGQLDVLFLTRGFYLESAGRHRQAVAYYRECARLATQAGDNMHIGRALLNLADALAATDPAAAAEAARTAAGHVRRAGARRLLAGAVINLVQALLMLGDWDAAQAELTQATEAEGLADIDELACYRGWVAALRGDTGTAATTLAELGDLPASEDPQDYALISVVEAFTAAARGQRPAALRHARAALTHAGVIGISHEYLRWAWPPASHSNCATPPPPTTCWPCSTPTSPGTSPRCCGPNATWPAPGWPPPTARTAPQPLQRAPRPPSSPRSPACASAALPITSRTACSTTPSTCRPKVTPTPQRWPSKKPATSPDACAASRSSTGPPQTLCASPAPDPRGSILRGEYPGASS